MPYLLVPLLGNSQWKRMEAFYFTLLDGEHGAQLKDHCYVLERTVGS
jgi:hypothetical protein